MLVDIPSFSVRVGDEIVVNTPIGEIEYYVVAVQYEPFD